MYYPFPSGNLVEHLFVFLSKITWVFQFCEVSVLSQDLKYTPGCPVQVEGSSSIAGWASSALWRHHCGSELRQSECHGR